MSHRWVSPHREDKGPAVLGLEGWGKLWGIYFLAQAFKTLGFFSSCRNLRSFRGG